MAFRDQRRRPLVLILLVAVPVFVVLLSVAKTQPNPLRFELPGGAWVATTDKALHGPEMAKITVAFVAALVGVFVMQSALSGDRRLVAAGYRASETILARLSVLAAATVVVVAVSALAMRVGFTPAAWPPVIVALLLTGLIYGAIGALAGALLDRLAATYLILFLAMSDFGVVQTPMFHATPAHFGWLFPGYAPTRVMLEGSYSPTFHAVGDLVLALAWAATLALSVYLVVHRRLGVEERISAVVPSRGIEKGWSR
jgi:hypothetical protein